MKKKIKIIDILCYISTGDYDKLPKKIKYRNQVWYFDETDDTYYNEDDKLWFQIYSFKILNDEVEILDGEDEFEDIKEIIYPDLNKDYEFELQHKNIEEIYDVINQLIRNQKKIIERLSNE